VPPMRTALMCVLVGCAYQPGSFAPATEFPGTHATVGCLDVAIDRRADLPIGPVLHYQLANRCDRAAIVDLGAATVVAHHADGTQLTLAPYDPQHELHPVSLDGRNVGGEALAYPAPAAITQLCVDLAALVHQQPAQWRCFDTAPAATTNTAAAANTAATTTDPAITAEAESRRPR
jgi:hypothetical protein